MSKDMKIGRTEISSNWITEKTYISVPSGAIIINVSVEKWEYYDIPDHKINICYVFDHIEFEKNNNLQTVQVHVLQTGSIFSECNYHGTIKIKEDFFHIYTKLENISN